MYDFQKHITFLQKWILNLQDLLRSQSLETVPVCIVWQYFPHDNIICIHLCAFVTSLVHFVMDRASLFTDHTMSSLPIHAKYKHFRTI